MRQEELMELLREKLSIFRHFKQITEEREYKDAVEDNADRYVSVITLRERDLNRVSEIDKKIAEGYGDEPFPEEALQLKEEIMALIQSILANEKLFTAKGQHIKNKLQASIKLMHQNKDSTKMYNHDAVHLQASQFDSKG